MGKVAVVGAGLIGRAWAMVFARAGWEVALYDSVPGVAEAGLGLIGEGLSALAERGLADDPAGAGEEAWGGKAVHPERWVVVARKGPLPGDGPMAVGDGPAIPGVARE